MQDRWGNGPADRQDDLDLLVHLSNRVGEDLSLVQPGGGNSSIKLDQVNPFGETERVLLVKGSGTDLRTIGRAGFTRLSMQRLAALRERGEISDEAMMEFMGARMLYPHADPVPSVETPLHSVLPHRVILHTHDVVTMSLTNLPEACARSVMKDLYGDRLAYIPYVRPGVPLARAVMEFAIPYAKERVAFGQPIAQKQAIAFKLAEMRIEVNSMRHLVWKAASQLEHGLDATRASTLAQTYVSRETMKIADNGLQTFGGHGYIREYPVEMWYRNARALTVLEGVVAL